MKFLKYIQKIKKMKLPKGEYAIFGSGPLAIKGIRDSRDVDIIVSDDLFKSYETKPGWKVKKFERGGRDIEMLEKDSIEFYRNWGPGNWDIKQLIRESEIIDDLPFVKLEEVIRWKKISGREKDLNDIKLINKFLQSQKL